MPATDSAALIVARYLKANNYISSYDAFTAEAGLPGDAGIALKGDLTLETLLEEKKTFDVAVRFEKLGVQHGHEGWSKPAPSVSTEVETLPTASNILGVRVESIQVGDVVRPTLIVSTADRRLNFLDISALTLESSLMDLHDSPILSSAILRERLLTVSMSGQLHVSDMNGNTMERRRDHIKYVVKVAVLDNAQGPIVATASWDSKISIYRPSTQPRLTMGQPAATIPLATKPEAMLLTKHPHNGESVLLVSRTDSSFIYYYSLEDPPRLLGKQNLAPHSNAWVALTPSAMDLCPTDPGLLAVGTSSVPHMKLLIVRLLFPRWIKDTTARSDQTPGTFSTPNHASVIETHASQARADLAIADQEANAIQIHATSMAPQTAYSTPAVAWRPDGSGVWVNGDDGAIRGIEASTGKVSAVLRGHEVGSKVRCLWAGRVFDQGKDSEILVSGGFDQKLVVWRA